MVLFGSQAWSTRPDLQEPIQGSLCCTGRVLASAEPWLLDYLAELVRFMATFMVGMGLLVVVTAALPFRRGERWAWGAMWVLPGLFLVHGFVLGTFPFDVAPVVVTLLGQLLGARRALTGRGAPSRAGAAVAGETASG